MKGTELNLAVLDQFFDELSKEELEHLEQLASTAEAAGHRKRLMAGDATSYKDVTNADLLTLRTYIDARRVVQAMPCPVEGPTRH